MLKKITIIGIIGVIVLISSGLYFVDESSKTLPQESNDTETTDMVDVVMPTKVSRPGCEENNLCYIPHQFVIEEGETVTWINEDSAFHSVTSGLYDAPTDLFDSGYLDPYQTFSFTFDESGTYDYYCTLHFWMEGQIIVE